MQNRLLVGAATALAVASWAPLEAQIAPPKGPELLMHPQYNTGQPVSPIFEGWYPNPDGTYTLSFGFFNRNAADTLDIAVGPNNFIEPAQFNGDQPTSFPSNGGGGFPGRGTGVFSVVVPSTFQPGDRVVWTLKSEGVVHSVPGKIGLYDYRIAEGDAPSGGGSMAPTLRFDPNGPEVRGRVPLYNATTLRTRVGQPLTLSVWGKDNAQAGTRQPVPLAVTWWKHQGPPEGRISFGSSVPVPAGPGATSSTTATFDYPGEYVVRITLIPTGARDVSFSDQCCWTNGYQRVTVSP